MAIDDETPAQPGADSSVHADSAGAPWSGRHFEPNQFSGDDGAPPEKWIEAMRRFNAAEVEFADILEVLAEIRLLIPLVARESDAPPAGAPRAAELATPTVATPDGRQALPVFTSSLAMGDWNPLARPVPAEAPRVALAAAGEGTPCVIVDPGAPTEVALRWSALQAVASGERWVDPVEDPRLLDAFMEAASESAAIKTLILAQGDPQHRLAGPEVMVQLGVIRGLDAADLQRIADELSERWSADETIRELVDSIGIRFVLAEE